MGSVVRNNGGDFNKPLVRKVPLDDIVNAVRGLKD